MRAVLLVFLALAIGGCVDTAAMDDRTDEERLELMKRVTPHPPLLSIRPFGF